VDASDNESFIIGASRSRQCLHQIATVGEGNTSFTDTSAAPGGTYVYRVLAFGGSGTSDYSNEALWIAGGALVSDVSDTEDPDDVTRFKWFTKPPHTLEATVPDGLSAALSWVDASSNETGFTIERSTGLNSYERIGGTDPDVSSYIDNGVATGLTYHYRVRANGSLADSDFSNEASVTIGDQNLLSSGATGTAGSPADVTESVPNAPHTLNATLPDGQNVVLTWVDSSSNETGFSIERTVDLSSYSLIAAVGADVTTYTDLGVTAGTAYVYRVRANGPSGDSVFSNEIGIAIAGASGQGDASGGTSGDPGSTAGPSPTGGDLNIPPSLTASFDESLGVVLAWTDTSEHETGFTIERSNVLTGNDLIVVTSANDTSYTDTFVSANTTYVYRMRANGPSGNSGYSNEASVTTGDITAYDDFPFEDLIGMDDVESAPAAPQTVSASYSEDQKVTYLDRCLGERDRAYHRAVSGCNWLRPIAVIEPNVMSYTDSDVGGRLILSMRAQAFRQSLATPTKPRSRP
jgi:titin